MYAKWQANDYTVTLNANGGSVNPGQIKVQFDAPYNHYTNLPTPTRRGYDFQGWYTDPTNGDRVYDSTPMTTPRDHTLYAHWKIHTYNVAISVSGSGTAGSTNVKVDYKSTNTVTITANANYLVRKAECTGGYTASGTFGKNAVGTQTYTIANNDNVTDATCTFTIAPMRYATSEFNCLNGAYKVEGDCKRDYVADDCSCSEWNQECTSHEKVCVKYDQICQTHTACKRNGCRTYTCEYYGSPVTGTLSTNTGCSSLCANPTKCDVVEDSVTLSGLHFCEVKNIFTKTGSDSNCGELSEDVKSSSCTTYNYVRDDSCACESNGWVNGDCASDGWADGDCNGWRNTTCKTHSSCPHTDNGNRQYYCADTDYHIENGTTCVFAW